MSFANDFKATRERAGLTQNQAAERLGKARYTIQRWESGAVVPHERHIPEIMARLSGDLAAGPLSFNLVDEPWLTVVPADALALPVEISLRDALTEAHRFRELVTPSPIITVALTRFLIAVATRAYATFGFQLRDERGELNERIITEYLETWHERFDLGHPERPFYQGPSVPIAKGHDAWKLTHSDAPWDGRPLDVAQATSALIMHHAYALGGMTNGGPGAAGLLTPAIVTLIERPTLAETIVANAPLSVEGDIPAWERDPSAPTTRAATGPLDLLTWQSRRIKLGIERDQSGQLVVPKAAIFPGDVLNTPPVGDPHLAFARRTYAGEERDLPIPPRENRSFWRDLPKLLAPPSDAGGMAPVLAMAPIDLDPIAISATGMITDKKVIRAEHHERFVVPRIIMTDPGRYADLAEAIQLAEDGATLLAGKYAPSPKAEGKFVISPGWTLARLLISQGEREPDDRDIRNLLRSLGMEDRYWRALTPLAPTFLLGLNEAPDSARSSWRTQVIGVVRSVFVVIERQISGRQKESAFAQAGRVLESILARWEASSGN